MTIEELVKMPEPVAYWYRNITPEGEAANSWKPVEPRNPYMNTVEDSARELLGYRYKDKPCYEVMPIHSADQLRAHSEAVAAAVANRCADLCAATGPIAADMYGDGAECISTADLCADAIRREFGEAGNG